MVHSQEFQPILETFLVVLLWHTRSHHIQLSLDKVSEDTEELNVLNLLSVIYPLAHMK